MRTWSLAVATLLAWSACGTDALAEDFGAKLFKRAARRFTTPRARAQEPPKRGAIEIRDFVINSTDDWKLVAKRYRVPDKVVPQRLPVILCHGFGYNARFFDLSPEVSLARYLAEAGFDVWAVNLRGCGQSSKWALAQTGGADALLGRFAAELTTNSVPKEGYASLKPRYAKWTLDDHVDYDVPALIHLVKHHTRAEKITWVGHSMGGNVMLAHLGKYDNPAVGRLVTVGSQVTMPEGRLFLEFLGEYLVLRTSQLQGAGSGTAEQSKRLMHSMDNIFFNERNTDPQVKATLLGAGKDVPSVGLIRQYQALSTSGRLRSANREIDYASRIGYVACPTLVVGGAGDQVAPPRAQQQLFHGIGAKDKTFLVLAANRGFSTDYGHNDSLVGRRVREEVFPKLARWLAGEPIEVTRTRTEGSTNK